MNETVPTNESSATVVVYAAKSSADERGSLDSQIAACRDYCERNGWTVAGEWRDEAASGYSGSRGAGLLAAKQQAAELASSGGDVVLLVFASDRLARGDGSARAAHLVEHVLDARKAGYRVEAVTEDLGGEMALLLAALYGERANADSRAKAVHVKRGLAAARASGRYIGSRPPFGYRFDGVRETRRLVVNAEAAGWYLRMVDWTEQGAGIYEVAGRLNDAGVRSPTAGLLNKRGEPVSVGTWTRSTVAQILRSPVYCGKIVYRGDNGVEYLPGEHEPLIDEPRWTALQQLRRSRIGRSRRPQGSHLLNGGLLRCPTCSSKMRARTTPRGFDAYECRNKGRRRGGCSQSSIGARELDDQIAAHLLAVGFNVREIAARVAAQIDELTNRAAEYERAARAKVAQLDQRIERVRNEYLGVVGVDEWQRMMRELEAERAKAEAHADEMLDLAAAEQRKAADLDEEQTVIRELGKLRTALAERDVTLIRERIQQTFGAVWLSVSETTGRYYVSFEPTLSSAVAWPKLPLVFDELQPTVEQPSNRVVDGCQEYRALSS